MTSNHIHNLFTSFMLPTPKLLWVKASHLYACFPKKKYVAKIYWNNTEKNNNLLRVKKKIHCPLPLKELNGRFLIVKH